MPLNHVLASNAFGAPLDDQRRAKAFDVLRVFGFHQRDGVFQADDSFDWLTITEEEGCLHVHARSPLPAHLLARVLAALDGLAKEAGLVRTDPLRRAEIPPTEWLRIVAEESRRSGGER